MEKLYNVGAYVRSSLEAASYDSETVENQCQMLSKFIDMMPQWVEFKIYIDDGYSGVSFQRPAFQEMIEDARQCKINLVLVKDLSRFGRNYLEAGHYLEELLPSLGCRFVAFQDGIDTEDGENDVMPFLNAMNDYYAKNLSDRLRSVFRAKAKDGQKITSHANYGFRRCDKDKSRLVIDEYSASVVRRIYEMRKDGMGYGTIAKTLTNENILPPELYYLKISGASTTRKIKSKSWMMSSINRMLRNEVYIGNAIQLTRTITSYRDKRQRHTSEEEQIRVNGAFPAIIDKDLWDAVQLVNKQASLKNPKRQPPKKRLFSDMLFCLDCGAKMHTGNSTLKNGNDCIYYYCSRHQLTVGTECSRHAISQSTLSKLVFGEIQRFADEIALDEQAVIEVLAKRLIGERKASATQRKKEVIKLKQHIHKLESEISKLYEGRIEGKVSNDIFTTQMQNYDAERIATESQLAKLEATECEATEKLEGLHKWIHLIKETVKVTEPNRDLLLNLIEKIEIGEKTTVNGLKMQDVVIHYRFVGVIVAGINECA